MKIVDKFQSEIRIPNVCKSNSNSNLKTEVWKLELRLTSHIKCDNGGCCRLFARYLVYHSKYLMHLNFKMTSTWILLTGRHRIYSVLVLGRVYIYGVLVPVRWMPRIHIFSFTDNCSFCQLLVFSPTFFDRFAQDFPLLLILLSSAWNLLFS